MLCCWELTLRSPPLLRIQLFSRENGQIPIFVSPLTTRASPEGFKSSHCTQEQAPSVCCTHPTQAHHSLHHHQHSQVHIPAVVTNRTNSPRSNQSQDVLLCGCCTARGTELETGSVLFHPEVYHGVNNDLLCHALLTPPSLATYLKPASCSSSLTPLLLTSQEILLHLLRLILIA